MKLLTFLISLFIPSISFAYTYPMADLVIEDMKFYRESAPNVEVKNKVKLRSNENVMFVEVVVKNKGNDFSKPTYDQIGKYRISYKKELDDKPTILYVYDKIIDDKVFGEAQVGQLQPGESKKFKFYLKLPNDLARFPSKREIIAHIDYTNEISESNESNNTFTKILEFEFDPKPLKEEVKSKPKYQSVKAKKMTPSYLIDKSKTIKKIYNK